ncbi:heme biosynthesis HemY N-terminal domain-containing protein [Thiomicrorhabdus arctica]|uniref:heme biosynthesis HemY N-terminal domain-containing protein n=1 Tax=Thiomicrorhabdus arctica TaxID=131540 RepID=UPI00037523BF|nr:heme biosynthesis HemY N-terminal domain-containing protein [Thiomicrorhabdus arctica]
MRLILIWAIVFLVGTGLATLLLYDNGQVSMVWNDWVIETSLSFLVAAVAVAFISGYFLIRLFLNLWHLPVFWRHSRRLHRYSKAENSMAKGMIALEYGDWQTAEKQLIKSAKQSEAGLVHYLSAAKMAHNQKAYDRRDQYLQQARDEYVSDYVTIGLVEARLLWEEQPEVALSILETLHEQHPKHITILAEYSLALRQLGLWKRLEDLLPVIKKTRAIDKAELLALEHSLLAGKLATAMDETTLDALWAQLNSRQKLIPQVLVEYVEQRIGRGQEVGLALLIEKALKKEWNDRLVYQYGRLTLGPAFERLKKAEMWLKDQENNPVLLLSLGRLACRSQLWGRGQNHLQESLKIRPEVETYHALAQCYEAEGKDNQAALTYKEAIVRLEGSSLLD